MPCRTRHYEKKCNLIAIVHVHVKKFTASYEPYKRLLPVVLLPFARDATSAYKLNTSIVRLARPFIVAMLCTLIILTFRLQYNSTAVITFELHIDEEADIDDKL